jgi:uncharacterized membrane protein YoaK (UPF0700 family)
MRERFRQNRALFERAILAFILPGVAGAINASGFFAVGTYTSHMTGNVARIGDELVTGHYWLATRSLIFVGSFLCGAMVSTFLVLYGKRVGGPPYWRPLLLECALLFVFATVNVGSEHRAHLNSLTMTALICSAMGLQNALVTKLSGARIRTTHMTGITTDIGIEAARTIDTWREGTRGMGFAASMWHLKSFWQDHELHRLRLHLAVLGSFLIGATLGPLCYVLVGHIAMLVPCAVLAALAAFDGWIGLSARTLGQPPDAQAQTSA